MAGPKLGGPGSHRGPRPAVGRHWHGRTAFPISRAARQSASARGSTVEVGPGRLVPWLAIAFGCGIAIYFAIDREPAPWAAGLLLAATAAATVLARRRPFAFPLALGAAALAAGLATATIKRAIIAHPVLSAPFWNVDIAGFVEIREERERSDRIVVRIERIAGPRLEETLERVRVSVRKGTAPAVGSVRRVQGATVSSARAFAPRRLRLRARHVLQSYRRVRLRARPYPRRRDAACTEPPAAIRDGGRRNARGDRPAHPRGFAWRQRRNRIGRDHGQAGRDHAAGERGHVRIGPRPRAFDLRLAYLCFPHEAAGARISLAIPI